MKNNEEQSKQSAEDLDDINIEETLSHKDEMLAQENIDMQKPEPTPRMPLLSDKLPHHARVSISIQIQFKVNSLHLDLPSWSGSVQYKQDFTDLIIKRIKPETSDSDFDYIIDLAKMWGVDPHNPSDEDMEKVSKGQFDFAKISNVKGSGKQHLYDGDTGDQITRKFRGPVQYPSLSHEGQIAVRASPADSEVVEFGYRPPKFLMMNPGGSRGSDEYVDPPELVDVLSGMQSVLRDQKMEINNMADFFLFSLPWKDLSLSREYESETVTYKEIDKSPYTETEAFAEFDITLERDRLSQAISELRNRPSTEPTERTICILEKMKSPEADTEYMKRFHVGGYIKQHDSDLHVIRRKKPLRYPQIYHRTYISDMRSEIKGIYDWLIDARDLDRFIDAALDLQETAHLGHRRIHWEGRNSDSSPGSAALESWWMKKQQNSQSIGSCYTPNVGQRSRRFWQRRSQP